MGREVVEQGGCILSLLAPLFGSSKHCARRMLHG
jgi:hypothetical protein